MPELTCPACQKQLEVPAGLVGKRFRCPLCKTAIDSSTGAVLDPQTTPVPPRPAAKTQPATPKVQTSAPAAKGKSSLPPENPFSFGGSASAAPTSSPTNAPIHEPPPGDAFSFGTSETQEVRQRTKAASGAGWLRLSGLLFLFPALLWLSLAVLFGVGVLNMALEHIQGLTDEEEKLGTTWMTVILVGACAILFLLLFPFSMMMFLAAAKLKRVRGKFLVYFASILGILVGLLFLLCGGGSLSGFLTLRRGESNQVMIIVASVITLFSCLHLVLGLLQTFVSFKAIRAASRAFAKDTAGG